MARRSPEMYKYKDFFQPECEKRKVKITSGEFSIEINWKFEETNAGVATFIINGQIQNIINIDDKKEIIVDFPYIVNDPKCSFPRMKHPNETMAEFNGLLLYHLSELQIGMAHLNGKKIAYTSVMTGPIKTSA